MRDFQETLYKKTAISNTSMIYYFLLSISLQTTHFIYMLNNVRNQRTNIKIFVLVNRWYHMALQGRKILPAYNFLRVLVYISTFRSLSFVRRSARKSDTRRKLPVAKSRLNQPVSSENVRDLYGLYGMRLP